MKTKIEKNKKTNSFKVTMSEMSEGKVMALRQALRVYANQSVVGNDVKISLENSLTEFPEII